MFDAVTTFAKALLQLKNTAYTFQSPTVSCRRASKAKWESGQVLMNHIKNVSSHLLVQFFLIYLFFVTQSIFDGLTGPIQFNENGQRVNFTMRILAIQQYETNFNQTGFWTGDRGVVIARAKQEDAEEDIRKMLRNRRTPLRVATKDVSVN